MNEPTGSANLRVAVGRDDLWRYFVPTFMPNGDLILPPRHSSLLSIKIKGRVYSKIKHRSQSDINLWKKKVKNLSFKPSIVEILSKRNFNCIRRIEQEVHGFIDSLILSRFSIFDKKNHPLIRRIIRKIFHVGVFNIDMVTSQWKNFTDFLYQRSCRLEFIEPVKLISNLFTPLLELEDIRSLLDGVNDRYDCVRLSALLSTRQMVPGGPKVSEKAVLSFYKTTSCRYPIQPDYLNDFSAQSKIFGKICGKYSMSAAHLSLSTAGDYDSSVEDGGRAAIMVRELKEIMNHIEPEDSFIESPFGPLISIAGFPRRRTWGLDPDTLEIPFIIDYDAPLEHRKAFIESSLGHLFSYGDFAWDGNLAYQFLIGAWYKGYSTGYLDNVNVIKPIPARIITVPEPGGKVRIVTTTKWWVNVLQQPLGHCFRELLSKIPEAHFGLKRSEQAWQFLKILAKTKAAGCCLSSDLKEATDALPRQLMAVALKSFFLGCGHYTSYVELAINLLCSARQIEAGDLFLSLSYATERGVLMGEPLTKGALTLYSLVVEQLALRKYLKIGLSEVLTRPDYVAFAVGGDDHIAVGPEEYLLNITHFHKLSGSILSPGKHGISRLCVKYCEKLLLVSQFSAFKDFGVKWNAVDNPLHPYVDSLKVRILSPLTKTLDVVSDRNVAIGKGHVLGNTFRTQLFEPFYSIKWKKIVRERFIQRMGSFLPGRERRKSLFYQLLLPFRLGGLGLWFKDELTTIYANVPGPTRDVINGMMEGQFSLMNRYFLTRLVTNSSFRGYSSYQESLANLNVTLKVLAREGPADLREIDRPIFSYYEALSMARLAEPLWTEFDAMDAIHSLKIESIDEFYNRCERPTVFTSILMGQVQPKPFNTVPWHIRYAQIWDYIYRTDDVPYRVDVSDELLEKAFNTLLNIDFVNLKFETNTMIGRISLENLCNNMPTLKVKQSSLWE